MAIPSDKLAEALQTAQAGGLMAIRTSNLSRTNLERLLDAGFLKPVIKRW